MKVLVIQPVGHATGHHSYYTRRLCESLLDTGEVRQVTVVTYAGLRDGYAPRDGLTVLQVTPEQQIADWNPGQREDLWARCSRATMRAALPLIAGHDVVQALDCWYRTLAWHVWRRPRLGEKLVVLWHHAPHAAGLPPLRELPRGLRTRLMKTIPVFIPERLLVSRTTTLVHAETVADIIHRWLPDARVVVIPPGSDPRNEDLPSREQARRELGLDIGDAFALLIFGYLGRHKGVDVLLEALRDDPPHLRLLIAGPPANDIDVPAMLEEAGWADRATLSLGYVPDDRVHLWFRAADAVLLAYPRGFIQNSGVLTRAADF
ncbi:MAG: glycosyltransferase, partial [Armatimonadetes bacterium]|nr:glycosyltransferase [Armatimonadota bacterium]